MSGASPSLDSQHEVVRAGAGAGKTYTLTHKVMDLADASLRERGRLPKLIVTTFTRKATEELRERLLLLALEEKPHLLDFVNSRSQLVVSTIHGVMDLFLKRHGADLGLDPSYRIIGSSEANKLARQSLRRVLFAPGEERTSDLLESFPFNLLAKLVRRIEALSNANPEALPFSLADFVQIFRARTKQLSTDLKEAALCIREEATKDTWLKLADLFFELSRLLADGDWVASRARVQELCEELPVVRRNPKGAQPVSDSTMELAKAARANVRELLEPLYDPAAWAAFAQSYEAINEIARKFSVQFREAKLAQGVLEIGDLELLVMSGARQFPEAVEAFSLEWDHWLVDEFQDTSPFQVELLRRLCGQSPTFVVGDPQQSIYLFRGARSEVFAAREVDVDAAGGTRHFLRVNRRSRPELLLFINDFFSGFEPPFAAMEPFYAEGEQVALTLPTVAKIFIASEPEAAEPAEGEEAENSADSGTGRDGEMRALVAHIQGLLASGSRPEEICVLGRTNRALMEAAELLSTYRIPVHVHAASGFYDRREIRDALALLRFLVNPHDDCNLVELLRSPWFRVPDRELVEARRKPSGAGSSLWQMLTTETSLSSEFEAVHRLIGLIRKTATDGFTETFRRTIIETGFVDFSHLHDVSGRREANLWKLFAKLQQEETKPGFNPIEFVHAAVGDLKLEEGNAEGDAVAAIEPNRVNLMTVHASKGLEFAHVCLPCMDQRPRLTSFEDFTYDERQAKWALRAPFGEHREMTKSLPEDEWLGEFRVQELREHARVLYVALTRASQSIYLSWTGPPKTASWAELLVHFTDLKLSEGQHATASYAYQILRAEPELQPIPAVSSEAVELRAPWQNREDQAGNDSKSVSDLLEESAGRSLVVEGQGDIVQLLRLATQGTAVHRLVEILKYPSRDKVEFLVDRWFPNKKAQVLAAIEFVRQSKAPPLMELIENGEVEWGFSFLEGGRIVEGQIDLWGQTASGEVWVVDYKTGNPEYREKAFDQMAIYAHAVRKSGRIDEHAPIRFAAVYPFAKEIFTAPEPAFSRVQELLLDH